MWEREGGEWRPNLLPASSPAAAFCCFAAGPVLLTRAHRHAPPQEGKIEREDELRAELGELMAEADNDAPL